MVGRFIDQYRGEKNGPLLICIGAIHGNEPAGIEGIKEFFNLLHLQKDKDPDFIYHGTALGLIGNMQALRAKKRYIQRDLNRMLTSGELERIRKLGEAHLMPEELECLELITIIEEEISRNNYPFTLIVDFHTTTADGGVFTISPSDPASMKLAEGLGGPVILGIAEGLKGTTIDYFNQPGIDRHCLVFEAGQHEDPQSKERITSVLVNCTRSIQAVSPVTFSHFEKSLSSPVNGLPKVLQLEFHYLIKEGENFRMKPGYTNFQFVTRGEILAENDQGLIACPIDGWMLMPKYQAQGNDGFFIVRSV